jgi:hypothetical protein
MRAKARKAASGGASAAAMFENIEFLINGNGDITIGRVASIPCAATAADHDQCLAMLVRRPGESLLQLMQRLDAAIASAYEDGHYIDEINGPSAPSQDGTAGRLRRAGWRGVLPGASRPARPGAAGGRGRPQR